MDTQVRKFNGSLLFTIFLVLLVVGVRLLVEAMRSNNWLGFIYSMLHVTVVGAGTYLALRRKDPHQIS